MTGDGHRPDDVPQFGTRKPGEMYRRRRSVYGIAFRDGRVLVVETDKGLYLPGGGIDDGETPAESLRREFVEETGYAVRVVRELCRANQYVWAPDKRKGFHKLGAFYLVEVTAHLGDPTEPDHAPAWRDPRAILDAFTEANHGHALAQALQQ